MGGKKYGERERGTATAGQATKVRLKATGPCEHSCLWQEVRLEGSSTLSGGGIFPLLPLSSLPSFPSSCPPRRPSR